jgi:hypothetical protein
MNVHLYYSLQISVKNYKMMSFGFKFKPNHVEESLNILT